MDLTSQLMALFNEYVGSKQDPTDHHHHQVPPDVGDEKSGNTNCSDKRK